MATLYRSKNITISLTHMPQVNPNQTVLIVYPNFTKFLFFFFALFNDTKIYQVTELVLGFFLFLIFSI